MSERTVATPYQCPVCNGTGLVSRPPGMAGDVEDWSSTDCVPYTCKACSGTCIVWSHTIIIDAEEPRDGV